MDQSVGTWILGIVVVLIQCALTTILGLIIKTKWDKKNKEREELEKLREEKRSAEQAKTCNSMKDTIHTEIVDLEKTLSEKSDHRYNELLSGQKSLQQDIGLLKDGLQKDLYVDLCNIYDQYKERVKLYGHISRGEKTEYDKLYWSYHNLGKNGVVDNLHEQVMKLPSEPTDK